MTYKDLIRKEEGKVVLKSGDELKHKYDWQPYLQISDLFSKIKRNVVLENI